MQHEQAFQQSVSQHMQQPTPGFPHQQHQNMQQQRQQSSQQQQQQQQQQVREMPVECRVCLPAVSLAI
jgi:hypothetical protein